MICERIKTFLKMWMYGSIIEVTKQLQVLKKTVDKLRP